MNETPRISDAEWDVMRIVWKRHPITAAEIIESLSGHAPAWHPKTIRTLLARLVKKSALEYAEQGRSYIYRPLVTEEECVAAASDSFVDRIFGGSLRPMLAHFVEQRRLNKKDLEELRRMLDEAPSGNAATDRKKRRT